MIVASNRPSSTAVASAPLPDGPVAPGDHLEQSREEGSRRASTAPRACESVARASGRRRPRPPSVRSHRGRRGASAPRRARPRRRAEMRPDCLPSPRRDRPDPGRRSPGLGDDHGEQIEPLGAPDQIEEGAPVTRIAGSPDLRACSSARGPPGRCGPERPGCRRSRTPPGRWLARLTPRRPMATARSSGILAAESTAAIARSRMPASQRSRTRRPTDSRPWPRFRVS